MSSRAKEGGGGHQKGQGAEQKEEEATKKGKGAKGTTTLRVPR